MDRRSFIQGAFAIPVALAIPKLPYSPPVLKTNSLVHPRDLGCQMARALARSMMQTREQVAANVLNRAFGDDHG